MLQGFQNVGRHWGNNICQGSGTGINELRCPYHRWRGISASESMQIRVLWYDKCMHKQRVTVSVDEALLHEANTAVSEGRSRSVSEWISEAMAQRRDRDQRLAVLSRLVSEYEAEHGAITDDEIEEQAQRDRDAAASLRAAARRAG